MKAAMPGYLVLSGLVLLAGFLTSTSAAMVMRLRDRNVGSAGRA